MIGPCRVALIGPGRQENLALGYLAAAARKAGHKVELLQLDSHRDQTECVKSVEIAEPDLVGIGLSFQSAVRDTLSLATALRRGGYTGHITLGGHVPTFCYREILEDCDAVDSVVRHDGEETLVEMLERLGQGKPLGGVNGVVWRDNGAIRVEPPRLPVSDLDVLPWPARPRTPRAAAGVPLAFVIGSRGCVGDCAYCSIRAFTRDSGGPAFRLRRPEAVADELAHLHHEQGAQVALMQDDLFILRREKPAVERIRALKKALDERGVEKMIFWIKGRPESITRAVLDAARELNVAHIFLGIESAVAERLRYLGRTHTKEDNERALSLCREQRIPATFNLMMFDPDASMHDVQATIDFGEKHSDFPWNICRTEVYPGTHLFNRLKAEGRLEGDFTTYGYHIRDTRAEIMFRIIRLALKDRSLSVESVINRIITLYFTKEIFRRLTPGPATENTIDQIDALFGDVYRDTVSKLRYIFDFSMTVDSGADKKIRDFAVETALTVNADNHEWLKKIDYFILKLDAKGVALRLSPETIGGVISTDSPSAR
jgi:anaerobic magnesium-protoporphyrin IX monomethyl ester cyclase